jgi:hypothetical protein
MASSLLVLSELAKIALAVVFRVPSANHHPRPSMSSQGVPAHEEHHHALTVELWVDRCHRLCQCLLMSTCCLFGGQELLNNHHAASAGAYMYEHVARALADYLESRGTLDVVPTNLVTGLLVLQRLQRQRILQARLQVIRSSQSQLGSPSISQSTQQGSLFEDDSSRIVVFNSFTPDFYK